MSGRRRLVLLACPIGSLAGGVRHVAAVARAASEAGYEVEIYVVRRPGVPAASPMLRRAAPQARVFERSGGDLLHYGWPLLTSLRALRRRDTVVYAAFPQSIVGAGLARRLVRGKGGLVFAVQGDMGFEGAPPLRRRLFTALVQAGLNCRRYVVACVALASVRSNETRQGLRFHGATTVYVGNVAYGIGDAPWVVEVAASSPVQREATVVGVMARLEPEKGVDVLVSAARHLPASVTIEVFGSGTQREALERAVSEDPTGAKVRFLGWASDPLEPLRRWACLVIPSRTEGLPLVIAEAAWCGCPVVASSVGGIPEIAAMAGGIRLVPPGEPVALAEAVRAALDDPRPVAPDTGPFRWADFRARVQNVLGAATEVARGGVGTGR